MPDGFSFDEARDMTPVYEAAGRENGIDPDLLRAQKRPERSRIATALDAATDASSSPPWYRGGPAASLPLPRREIGDQLAKLVCGPSRFRAVVCG
jgi:hypothetical protein